MAVGDGDGVFDGRGVFVGVDVSVTGMTSLVGVVGADTGLVVQAPSVIKRTREIRIYNLDPRIKRNENRAAAGLIFMGRIYH